MRKLTLTLSVAALALAGTVAAQPDRASGERAERGERSGPITREQHGQRTAAMFARLDVNGDGVIDAQDRAARKAARFDRLDADGNGEVTLAEMQAAHAQRRTRGGQPDAERQARGAERLQAQFARLDTDGSGGISRAEMDAAKGTRAQNRSASADGEARAGKRGKRGGGMAMHGMLRQADTDGDGAISRAEFEAAAAQRFARMDTDGDGTVSTEERAASREAMRAAMQERRAARAAQQ